MSSHTSAGSTTVNRKFRTPPSLRLPPSARWEAVLPVLPELEIWFVSLRPQGSARRYYPVFHYVDDAPAPLSVDEARVLPEWGSRFFFNPKNASLIVQVLRTFEY